MMSLSGIALILLSACSFGSMALFARTAYAAGVDTATLLALRFALSLPLLALIARLGRHRIPRGTALLAYAGMGVLFAAMAWCYFSALHFASSGLVALLLYTYPLLVGVLAALLRIERLERAQWTALGLSSLGLVLLLANGLEGSLPGVGLALLDALIYSIYILLGNRFGRGSDPLGAALVVVAGGTLVTVALALWQHPHFPATLQAWGAVGAVSLLGTSIAMTTFFAGLARLGPTRSAMLSTVEPLVTVTLGIRFLGESLSWQIVVGGALVLGAAAGLTLRRAGHGLRRSNAQPG
ncbi:EamA family transporter [Paludibacterium yongneupense]|uniref:EamA family transporter n=1 Tax=Paludibacterium yongneupense TaxID=400061 RepID=UPI0003FC77A1|nr:DMT family transporter [Paludibacterium yongneupense]